MFHRLRNDKDQAGNLNSLSINQETGRVYVSGGIDYESTKVIICLFIDYYVLYINGLSSFTIIVQMYISFPIKVVEYHCHCIRQRRTPTLERGSTLC